MGQSEIIRQTFVAGVPMPTGEENGYVMHSMLVSL